MPQTDRSMEQHLEMALLVPDISLEKIKDACAKARRLDIAAVNVAPYYVAEAADALSGCPVAVGTSIGIPNASLSTAAKLAELRECIACGAAEVDVALNALAVKSGRMDDVKRELDGIVELAAGRAAVRPAFEHALYTDAEKEAVLELIVRSGAEWVKIQNVLSGEAARPEQVDYVRQRVGSRVKIKIDGGIKTLAHARELVSWGADRLGTSAAFEIAEAGR